MFRKTATFLLMLFMLLCTSITSDAANDGEDSLLRLEAQHAENAGKFAEAEAKYQKLLTLCEKSKDRKRIAEAIYLLANTKTVLSKYKEAISLLERAQRIHAGSKDWTALGNDLTSLALNHMHLGNYEIALKLCDQALKIHHESQNKIGIITTLRVLGASQMDQGQPEEAIRNATEALQLAESIGDEEAQGRSLMLLGSILTYKGEDKKAIEYFQRSIVIFERLGKKNLLADVMVNAGAAYADLGNVEKSLEYYSRSGALFEEVGDQYGVAVNSNNMGVSYYRLGEYGKSLESFKKAYEIELSTGRKEGQALGLSNMAYILQEIGDYTSALDHFNRGLKISEEIGDKFAIASTLMGIAISHEELREYSKALNVYNRHNLLAREAGYKKMEAESTMKIGVMKWRTGDSKGAVEQLQNSLKLLESLGIQNSIAENYYWLGTIQYSGRDFVPAEKSLLKSIDVLNETGYLTTLWAALYQLGLVYRDTGRLESGVLKMQEAVEVIERSRKELGLAEHKTGFLESKMDVYDSLVSILLSLHRTGDAYEYVQRSKARSFIDLLAEAHIDPGKDLSPELVARKKKLISDLMMIQGRIQAEVDKDNPDKERIQALLQERNALENKHTDLVLEIRRKNPRYADVQYPVPLKAAQAQKLLDSKTLLLEFYVRKSTSILFVVSKRGIQSFRLPDRQSLKDELLEFRMLVTKPDPAYDAAENSYYRLAALSYNLYTELIGRAQLLLAGKQRLIVAPDGPLHYLPFEALIIKEVNSKNIDFKTLPYLARNFEIQYVPSASVLAAVMSRQQQQDKPQRELLAFADPGLGALAARSSKDTIRIMNAASTLAPLQYARTEINEITSLYAAKDVTVLTGADASEKNLKSMDLHSYRGLHFASHALIDEEKPELSALILSGDEKSGEDGYLTTREVFDLNLNADLVVLSACKTAAGKEFSGEGVNGISRAFLLAGTPSIIVTLWDVYDRSTADLMASFYKYVRKEELTKGSAIKKAKLEMMRSGKFSHPFYWAPFILIGKS